MVVLIILSTHLNRPVQPAKAKPEEYFAFTEVGAVVDSDRSIQGGRIIFIKILHFRITPTAGDAHDIYIKPLAGDVPLIEYPYRLLLKKNETWGPEIIFKTPVESEPTPNGYPIEVGIVSREAEGIVTLYIDPDNIVWPP